MSLESAKITLSRKSLKFKFTNKNALTIKSDDSITSAQIDDKNYSFGKNSIINKDSSEVTLTSQFSGTYKIDGVNDVDGKLVKKNLTFKGTSAAETFTGGQKKTTFKGGGGDDTLTGGAGKDVFFYAKGSTGTSTINDFDFTKDKVKIANGTIGKISTVSGGLQFDMTSGKKGDTGTVGSFKLTTTNSNNVLIKANSTYYWFADADTASDTDGVAVGDLITADTKVSKANATSTGYAILDLGYSTNLVKTGVAVKVAGASPTKQS